MSNKLLKTHILPAKRQERISSLRSWFVLHGNIWQKCEEGDPSPMLCTGEATPGAVSSAELPSTRHSWTLRREPSEGPTRGLRVWRPWCIRKCWESLDCHQGEGSEGDLLICINMWRKGEKRSETGSLQWYPVTEPEAAGATEIQKVPSEHQENLFTVTVTKHWHKLLREAVEFLCLETFKSYLNMVLGKQI